jgi:hypothetical protein
MEHHSPLVGTVKQTRAPTIVPLNRGRPAIMPPINPYAATSIEDWQKRFAMASHVDERVRALQALLSLLPPRKQLDLAKQHWDDSDPLLQLAAIDWCRRQARTAAVTTWTAEDRQALVDALAQLQNSSDDAVSLEASLVLTLLDPARDGLADRLLPYLLSNRLEPTTLAETVRAVARLRGPLPDTVTACCWSWLADESHRENADLLEAVLTLLSTQPSWARATIDQPSLAELLDHDDPVVRESAARLCLAAAEAVAVSAPSPHSPLTPVPPPSAALPSAALTSTVIEALRQASVDEDTAVAEVAQQALAAWNKGSSATGHPGSATIDS